MKNLDIKKLKEELENKTPDEVKAILSELKSNICEKKNEYVDKHDFENAANFREIELTIMSILEKWDHPAMGDLY